MAKKKNPQTKKKPEYPKAMTIRYDAEQEKDIIEMMIHVDEKTMSKAFLSAPNKIEEQIDKINYLLEKIEERDEELEKLRAIAESWKAFNERLSEL